MALEEVSIAAASAPLGTNLLADSTFRQVGRSRIIRGAALAGSAAAGDTEVEILVGSSVVARLFNKATGFPTRDHLFPVGAFVPANTEVSARVTDAPSTNPINLAIDFGE